jgi:ferredoxin-like protein FixX
VRAVRHWLARVLPGRAAGVLYPLSSSPVPLVALGTLAGWHHGSPFRVGINAAFGSWFAYRALVLADSDFAVTAPLTAPSPCDSCADKPCITACPAGAVGTDTFEAPACFGHRLQAGSDCAARCRARAACPVASEHRYSEAQTAYHYGRSLESLRRYAEEGLLDGVGPLTPRPDNRG